MEANKQKYGDNNIRLFHKTKTLAIGKEVGNIYILKKLEETTNIHQEDNMLLWYNCLGHINLKYLRKLPNLSYPKNLEDKCNH